MKLDKVEVTRFSFTLKWHWKLKHGQVFVETLVCSVFEKFFTGTIMVDSNSLEFGNGGIVECKVIVELFGKIDGSMEPIESALKEALGKHGIE